MKIILFHFKAKLYNDTTPNKKISEWRYGYEKNVGISYLFKYTPSVALSIFILTQGYSCSGFGK